MFKLFWGLVFLLVAELSFATSDLNAPIQFATDMEQHGSFIAGDLRSSPLLANMFHLSVNEVNGDLIRICLNPQNTCRVVRRDAKVYVVVENGKAKFDDPN